MDTLQEQHYFSTPFYVVRKMEFLDAVRAVSDRYLLQAQKDQRDVVLMTANYMNEPELAEFAQYVSQTSWNILASQGYAMEKMVTFFMEMWTQEHNQTSYMETHVHGHGAQISAFYFLDVPPRSGKLVIHDPRPAKVIVDLPEQDHKQITNASQQIVFNPEPGSLVFTNSWVPHSFTKNLSEQSMRFVHMNLSVTMQLEDTSVEIL